MTSAETTTDPETGERLEKILIELPPGHWSGEGGERMWAKPLEDNVYEIRNTPWYADNLNWGDVVRCDGVSSADLPIVAAVVRPGGHRTLRVFFEDVGEARAMALQAVNREQAACRGLMMAGAECPAGIYLEGDGIAWSCRPVRRRMDKESPSTDRLEPLLAEADPILLADAFDDRCNASGARHH